MNLNIGRSHDRNTLAVITDLVHTVDLLNTTTVSKQMLRNIIRHYENC